MSGVATIDISTSFGATIIGLTVSTTLFGVTLSQTWFYFWKYRHRDPKALQFFVVFLTILDVFHTYLSTYLNYWYLILDFGNIDNLDVSFWAFHAQILIGAVVALCVQLFYARRVHIVSKSMVCPILIVVSAVVGFVFGIYYTVKEIMLPYLSEFHSLNWISSVALAAGAVADVLTAGSMCWYLYQQRTGFSRTDSIISTLMIYSVNTGLLTSALGIAVAISTAVSPATSLNSLAIFWVLNKCYINTLLAMLNSRDHVRDRSTTNNPSNAYNLSSVRIEPGSQTFDSKSGTPGVSVTMIHSATMDLGRDKSNHDEEPAFVNQKTVTNITPFQRRGQSPESST